MSGRWRSVRLARLVWKLPMYARVIWGLLRDPRVPLPLKGLLVAALAHWAEPWGFRQLNGVLNDVIKRNLQTGLEPGVFNDGLPRFMIYVAGEERAPDSAYATWRGVLIEDDVEIGRAHV